MSRITLRVGLSRATRLSISSLGHRPLTYLNPPPFSFSVGERKIMNHFVVETLTLLSRDGRRMSILRLAVSLRCVISRIQPELKCESTCR